MSSCYNQIQSRIEIAMFDLLPILRLCPLSEGNQDVQGVKNKQNHGINKQKDRHKNILIKSNLFVHNSSSEAGNNLYQKKNRVGFCIFVNNYLSLRNLLC